MFYFLYIYIKRKRPIGLTLQVDVQNLECCCQKIFKEEKPVHDLFTKTIIFFINKNQFIKLNSSNKSDYIVEKLKKVAFIAIFRIYK